MPSSRYAFLAAATLALCALVAAPAQANELGIGRTLPHQDITITYDEQYSNFHKICAQGWLKGGDHPAAPMWSLVVTGSRNDGSDIADQSSVVAERVSMCTWVWKDNAAYGAYTVTFSYQGIGNDLPMSIGGAGVWQPGTDNSFTVG